MYKHIVLRITLISCKGPFKISADLVLMYGKTTVYVSRYVLFLARFVQMREYFLDASLEADNSQGVELYGILDSPNDTICLCVRSKSTVPSSLSIAG